MDRAAVRETPAEGVTRTFVLEGRSGKNSRVTIEPAAPAYRISLRAPAESLASLSRALGVKPPEQPMGSAYAKSGDFAGKGGRVALWLGPDEWLVIDTQGNDPMVDCARAKALHSAVDISHRQVAIDVSGAGAADVLNAGCPRDLSLAVFPVGSAARTVLGKIEIVLLRTGEEAFRVECWRSFSDYAFTFLAEAARDVS
ncbi:MAG: sarcosine oxidase subunit gamma [Hyphomicrobiales bacterium]|nr:sarcosine oxidase subunit gamma [Hyphomicrobiales bacterium]